MNRHAFAVAGMLLLGCAPGSETLLCRADQAVVCRGGQCVGDPDANPHMELTLDRVARRGSLCLVTACDDFRWAGRGPSGEVRRRGRDMGYVLSLDPAESSFRLLSRDGAGWSGRCAPAAAS